MHPDNRFYGHDVILAEYCGIEPRPIEGHLQHGWGPTTGYSQFEHRLVRALPKLVWSESNQRAALERFGGEVRRVGAPFAYLCSMRGVPSPPSSPSTLFFPAHGWERHSIRADYGRLISAISDREPGPVTVCLYWHEFEQPEVRRQFERAGWRVVCNGRRNDPAFLFRFLDELRLHDRVASNAVGTPIWYGGLAGRAIEVYGPRFDFGDAAERDALLALESERWPDLVGGGVDGSRAHGLAAVELGVERLREPAELGRLLGWDGPSSRWRLALARAEHHVRRIAVNIGIKAGLEGYR